MGDAAGGELLVRGRTLPAAGLPGAAEAGGRVGAAADRWGLGARRTLALAARYAAEFNVPFADVQRTRTQSERVRVACEQAGRDPETLVYSHAVMVCCAASESELQRRAERIGRDLQELRQNGAAGSRRRSRSGWRRSLRWAPSARTCR